MRKAHTKHGHAPESGATPTYHTWSGMVARCNNPRHKSFGRYGGAGIRVCERWLTFANFLADMGEKPRGTSIDRIDHTRGYEPGNCRWATDKQQARNKRNNRPMTLDGVTRTQAEWVELLGIHQATLNDRLAHGWSDERALTTPAGTYGDNVRSRLITIANTTHTLSEWVRRTGVSMSTVYWRLNHGWSEAEAITGRH